MKTQIIWIYATSLLMSIKSRKPEEHDNCSQKTTVWFKSLEHFHLKLQSSWKAIFLYGGTTALFKNLQCVQKMRKTCWQIRQGAQSTFISDSNA